MELEAGIGYGDAGQNGQNQIGYEAHKKDFAKNMSFLSRWVRVCRRLHRFGQINPYPGDGRRRSKLQPAAANSMALKCEMRQTYLRVTFNAVARPVFTVAAVLTLVKPGAATVTV